MNQEEKIEHAESSIAEAVGDRLTTLGIMLATAESCTGGWIAKLATDIAGSSAWFDRGFVTYSNAAKQDMLGVSAQTLAALGAVSEAVAREMAQGALRHSRAGVALAVSGIAGPGGGTDEKPVGTVWLAWARGGGDVVAVREQFSGDRDAVRRQAAQRALRGVLDVLADG